MSGGPVWFQENRLGPGPCSLFGEVVGLQTGCLNLQILLEGLEQQFDLPPLAIHGSDGHRVEVKVIGQEDELPLMLCVPPDDASEEARIVAGGVLGAHHHLISADVRVCRRRPVLQLHPRSVVLEPRDEVDAADR